MQNKKSSIIVPVYEWRMGEGATSQCQWSFMVISICLLSDDKI